MTPGGALIFAAGFGMRMGPLTADCPKPLLTVAGETLLDRTVALARAAGIGRIAVNAHYRADRIAAHLAGSGIAVSVETPEILDTGGGLKAALPLLPGDTVATANPDAVFAGPNPFRALIDAPEDGAGARLLLIPLERALERRAPGDFAMDARGRLSRGGPLVYTGIQLIRTADVGAVPEARFSLNRVWDALIAEGRATGVVYPGRWCDVGTPSGLARAEALVAADA